MKILKSTKKSLLLCLMFVLGIITCTGCSKGLDNGDVINGMKKFEAGDGSFSIYFDKEWKEEDMGVDCWVCAGNKTGTKVCIAMQGTKQASSEFPVADLDTLITLVEMSYGFKGNKTDNVPDIPGLSNIEACEGELTADGESISGYVIYGESDYACYAFLFGANKMNDEFIENAIISCESFVETAPEIVNNTTAELTDTVRWFNASYAVLTELNGWNYSMFGGLPANDNTKALEQTSLSEWWGVTDRASADETLDWILSEGHRADFKETMELLTELGFNELSEATRPAYLVTNYEFDTTGAQIYSDLYAMYLSEGASIIDGWDYCRALNLLSYYYIAGYYTEEEALNKSLEIAQTAQSLFDSWDDMIGSYMLGYEYWAEESSAERRAIYEELKTRSDNPFAVDFKITLKKTW